MKIRKHVLAGVLLAGLAGMSGSVVGGEPTPATVSQVGYVMAKKAEKDFEMSENAAGATQAVAQAGGAAAGAAAGAWLGMKIGSVFGVAGAIVGAGAGAL